MLYIYYKLNQPVKSKHKTTSLISKSVYSKWKLCLLYWSSRKEKIHFVSHFTTFFKFVSFTKFFKITAKPSVNTSLKCSTYFEIVEEHCEWISWGKKKIAATNWIFAPTPVGKRRKIESEIQFFFAKKCY